MLLKDFLPPVDLRQYVQSYRIARFVFDKNQPLPFKAFAPRPENCLMFFLKESESIQFLGCNKKIVCPKIEMLGQQMGVINRFPGRDFLNFQIVFQPTVFYKLLKIPATHLAGVSLDAEAVFPKEIGNLYERLQDADEDYTLMISLANDFIINLIKKTAQKSDSIDKVSQLILESGGNVSLDWLANAACLSIKQFRRNFVAQVGLNPQHYSRIVRFMKAHGLNSRNPNFDWLNVALQAGYYDYQHLAKDYLEFTQQTPIGFHLLEGHAPERLLGISDEVRIII